jgi:16S rRNA (cytosine1402-N4)-methyltransferase
MTTGRLADIIEKAIPARNRYAGEGHPARRVFQAIRIEVNGELERLGEALFNAASCLTPGGRFCVITFHSLEDRIVKDVFRKMANPCECPRDLPVCVCLKKPAITLINKKPITPGIDERTENPRAQSAKLRIAERTGNPI